MSSAQPAPVPPVLAVPGRGVLAVADPVATADDLGLTRGDGCFDATLVVRGDGHGSGDDVRVLDLDDHLDRLDRSLAGLEITGAPGHDAWREAIDAAVAAWAGRQGALKLVVTRGRELAPDGPTAYLTLAELPATTHADRRGIRLCTLGRGYPSTAFADAPWLLGGVKTLSYAINVAAKREAKRRDADDVLFVSSDGYVLEGPTSSLVWLDGDTLVTTPVDGTGILRSITQTKVWAADLGLRTEYRLATPDAVRRSDGAWFLSSVRGVAPITHLDGAPLRQDAGVHRAIVDASGFAGL